MKLWVDIEKRLPGFHLQVQFAADAEATALLGASGCGKSMTLRCIAGVERPDKGRICLGDRVLFDSEAGIDLPPQQRRVGLLFQSYALFPHMTLEQNVACGLRQDKTLSKAERAARCAAMIQKLGLSGRKTLPGSCPAGSSSGRHWPASWWDSPEALLLDEPFSALDSFLREEVEAQLAALLAEFDRPALLVTHNRDEAYRLCPRTGGVGKGPGAAQRPPPGRSLLTPRPWPPPAYRVQEHPALRPACGTYRGAGGWGGALRWEKAVPEHCRFVGVRAHDLRRPLPGAENLVPVRPGQVSEDPFDWNLDCTSPAGVGHLWWKVSKGTLIEPCPPLPGYAGRYRHLLSCR